MPPSHRRDAVLSWGGMSTEGAVAKFCSECGHALGPGDKFCGGCGRKLMGDAPSASVQPATGGDWSQEHRYEMLKQIPEVTDRIARAAAKARTIWSAEELLDASSAFMGNKVGAKAGKAYSGLMQSLGVKTRHTHSEVVGAPIGTAIVRALCNMAANGRKLKQVTQLDDGVIIAAEFPSDMWNFAGEFTVTVRRSASGSSVDAEAYWPGEFWVVGKDKKAFAGLSADLRADML